MLVFDQAVVAAATPLKRTTLVPALAPKLFPVIVTEELGAPLVGKMDVMVGPDTTENPTALLGAFATVTTIDPVVAPTGTGTEMFVSDQLNGTAATPLKVTVLVPCGTPKFVPATAIIVFVLPDEGVADDIDGGGMKVKDTELLGYPPTVTMTGPVVAVVGTLALIDVSAQLVIGTAAPFNVTVLVPWVLPNFVPLTVITAPARAESGNRVEICGETPKGYALVVNPAAVVTVTEPLRAPTGTYVWTLVSFQNTGVAASPLNWIEPAPWLVPRFVPEKVTNVPSDA